MMLCTRLARESSHARNFAHITSIGNVFPQRTRRKTEASWQNLASTQAPKGQAKSGVHLKVEDTLHSISALLW